MKSIHIFLTVYFLMFYFSFAGQSIEFKNIPPQMEQKEISIPTTSGTFSQGLKLTNIKLRKIANSIKSVFTAKEDGKKVEVKDGHFEDISIAPLASGCKISECQLLEDDDIRDQFEYNNPSCELPFCHSVGIMTAI